MTDRWFEYVQYPKVEEYLAKGWTIAAVASPHSLLMEEPPLVAARRILDECERVAADAQTELHHARLAVLAAEDEVARAMP